MPANFFALYSLRFKSCLVKAVNFFLLLAGLFACSFAMGQKQLVILKGERVLLRLYPGDEIIFKLKDSKKVYTTYINNLFESSIVTHRDTVPFNTIDRIYFKQDKFYNRMGARFVVLGTALFLIDEINVVLVHGESPSLDNGVTTVSLSALAVGLPMMLLKSKSQKIGYKSHLLTVKKGSAFYVPDPRNQNSIFDN
jgi:hypothetical protein